YTCQLLNWLWSLDSLRLAARSEYPATLRRAYWHEREYQSDRRRLEARGYVIFSEEINDPYVTPVAWVPRGQPPRRRVPVYFVIYEHRADGGRRDGAGSTGS